MVADSQALTVVQDHDADLVPQFVMSIQQARLQLANLREFIREIMVEGEDYGVIPGTPKPTLLQPGAQKLNEIYGYAPVAEVVNRVEDWQGGFFHYEVKIKLISKRTGTVVAEGLGSCNSKEKRYGDRWVYDNELPGDVDKNSVAKREFTNRNGGKFYKYKWVNEDIFSLVNTILKMAKKRALIDATLNATRSSGVFTQDLEDLAGITHKDQPTGKAERPQPAQAPKQEYKPKPVERDPDGVPNFEGTPEQAADPEREQAMSELAAVLNSNTKETLPLKRQYEKDHGTFAKMDAAELAEAKAWFVEQLAIRGVKVRHESPDNTTVTGKELPPEL